LAALDVADSGIAATCLRSFIRLPALQRSAVILKDVLGHSLEEAASITGSSEVGEYFGAYAAARQWAFSPAMVEGRAAMLVFDRDVSLDTPAYFVALEFAGARVVGIGDFLYARYAMEGIEIRAIA
jgi:hypothetical protein